MSWMWIYAGNEIHGGQCFELGGFLKIISRGVFILNVVANVLLWSIAECDNASPNQCCRNWASLINTFVLSINVRLMCLHAPLNSEECADVVVNSIPNSFNISCKTRNSLTLSECTLATNSLELRSIQEIIRWYDPLPSFNLQYFNASVPLTYYSHSWKLLFPAILLADTCPQISTWIVTYLLPPNNFLLPASLYSSPKSRFYIGEIPFPRHLLCYIFRSPS